MDEEKKDFVIKDKRAFAKEDKPKETAEEERQAAEKETDQAEADYPLPEINFPTFIFSLNSSALLNLGAIEDPGTGQKTKNLPLARQTIDILGMLEEKTKGNLTDDEAAMLKNILYELRMLYVKEKG
jgi:hypothetical protein